MIRFILLLLVIAPFYRAKASEPTVMPSADWHEVDANIRKQMVKTDIPIDLIDAAVWERGGFASVQRFVIENNHPREEFDAAMSGSVAAGTMKGFQKIPTKTVNDSPFPRTGVLQEYKVKGRTVRYLVFATFCESTGYIFTLTGDEKLDFSSEMVRHYAQRIVFSNPSALDADGPKSKLVEAWEEGNRTGQIMITLLLLIVGLILFFRWQGRSRRAQEQPSSTDS